MFESLFATTTSTTNSLEIGSLLVCVAVALALGLGTALVYSYRSRHTKSFVVTLAVLPALVCVVIAMVNGNVGAGVAVAGAFSLVRFRSAAGNARDIGFIFFAMAIGLVCGMGYVVYAAIIWAIIACAYVVYQATGFGSLRPSLDRTLRITIPEDLDFEGAFDEVFDSFTSYHELISVKTTNMGSLFRLKYNIGMKSAGEEKAFIDALRTRNGNLEIAMSYQEVNTDEL